MIGNGFKKLRVQKKICQASLAAFNDVSLQSLMFFVLNMTLLPQMYSIFI